MNRGRWWFMNIKSFFMPDIGKVVITIILLSLSTVSMYVAPIPHGIIAEGSDIYMGFPMHFVLVLTYFGTIWRIHILWLGLMVDLVVYYFISCIVIWDYDTIRQKLSKAGKKNS